jgi:uncharacterized protein with HEPN domain
MKREQRLFLHDILTACQHIQEFVEGMTFDQFRQDEKTSSAVVRKLEIIGEATKNLSDEFKEKYPGVPWKELAGMRDRLAHGYFGVDYRLVWDTTQMNVPQLAGTVAQILNSLPAEGRSAS